MTRSQAESILVNRHRRILILLGLSTVTDGTNPDLADPLARAVRQIGGTTADPGSPTDAEISAISSTATGGVDRVLDAAEIALLYSIVGNWDVVNYTLDGRDEEFDNLLDAIQTMLSNLQKDYQKRYPVDPGTATSISKFRGGRLCPTPWAGLRPPGFPLLRRW